jgi:hypothetical protein
METQESLIDGHVEIAGQGPGIQKPPGGHWTSRKNWGAL